MLKDTTHPIYDKDSINWTKYRLTYQTGTEFINKYLCQYAKELDSDFDTRRKLTFVPAHAKSAINSIKNAIFLRMIDIVRQCDSVSYLTAINGLNGGVDLQNSTMNYFIGCIILPELLTMRRVGIFIDSPIYPENQPLSARNAYQHPYLYHYTAEDIRSWSYDSLGRLNKVLLRHNRYSYDEYGFPKKLIIVYRYLQKVNNGTLIQTFDDEDRLIEEYTLSISEIPFIILEISHSLLEDAADYQIALLNLASSDVNFATKSNFPFYTEQYMPYADLANVGESESDIKIGVGQGRRYPKGLERPQFIHPSPEPLRASLELKEHLVKELHQIINLNVTTLDPRRASAESKKYDDRDLEAGLAAIGLELEDAERSIARIWLAYERINSTPTINYPLTYSLKTDSERRNEAKELLALIAQSPSPTYQRIILKAVATILIGHKVTKERLQTIYDEIDATNILITDPEILRLDHEAGFVSTNTASKIRGYPEGEVEQAKKDHAERAARIVKAQISAKEELADANNTD